jgi:hypothetical protein
VRFGSVGSLHSKYQGLARNTVRVGTCGPRFERAPGYSPKRPGDLKPDRDYAEWRIRHLILVREHACFRLQPNSPIHAFSLKCSAAGNALLGTLRIPGTGLYVYENALPVVALEKEESISWCEVCFPRPKTGVRIDFDYIERVTGLSRSKLSEMWAELVGDPSLYGPS